MNIQFLADFLEGLGKRREAIRHKVRSLAIEQVTDDEQEKLEISSRTGPAALRLFLWDDRWVFFDARTRTKDKGWAWEFTHEGRLVGSDTQGLVEALEASIDAAYEQSSEGLERVWKPLLATGLRSAR